MKPIKPQQAMMKRFYLAIPILLFVLWAGQCMADSSLKVNTSIKPPFSTRDESGFFDVLIKKLASRVNMEVALVRQPPERALHSINEGISDVELPRIAGLQEKYPNLIQVDEPVLNYNFVAFSRSDISIASWDDLSGKRVGHLIGWKIFENNVPSTANVTKLRKPDLLFDMLDLGRIDVALYERHAGWTQIRSHGHKSIKECVPPLAVKPMYIYLHKNLKWLAPSLSGQLREMKADGTYQRIADETLNK